MHYRKLKTVLAGIVFVSLLASIIPMLGQISKVSANSVNSGIFCSKLYPLTTGGSTGFGGIGTGSAIQYDSCTQGYDGATSKKSEGQACAGVADATACKAGFTGGQAGSIPPQGPEANPSATAVFLCSTQANANNKAACELGYDNYGNGIPITNCAALGNGTSNLGPGSICIIGWNYAQLSAGQAKACANYVGAANGACIAGYQAANSNPNNPNPCKAYVDPADITACIGGWSTGGGITVLTPPSAPTDKCNASGWSLSWLVCAAIEPITAGVSAAQDGINNQLNIPVNNYFSDSCTNPTGVNNGSAAGCGTTVNGGSVTTSSVNYKIWSNMRNLALSLLVVVALIMVIGTALDIGPFDAYTVKKVLPRIVIAVFAITFSWEIGRFLVQFSDDVGNGISQLIYASAGITQADALRGIGAGFLAWMGVTAAVAGVALVVSLVTVGPVALLLLLLPLILGLGIAFFVLIIRRLIIVVCVVFSPIAFVAFILPGTQKIWKFWKDAFVGALFIYPMITAVLAIGNLLSYLTDNGNSGSSFLAPLTSLILYVAPFFLIPKLAKMATGALGFLTGAAHGVGRGGFAALTKSRKNQFAQKKQRSQTGRLYSNNSRFGKRMNAMGLGLAAGARGHYGVGKGVGKGAMDNRTRMAGAEAERDPAMQQLQFDDDGILAMHLSAGNEDNARRELSAVWRKKDGSVDTERVENAINTAKSVGLNTGNAMAAGGLLMRNKARSLPASPEGAAALARTSKLLSRGNKQLQDNIDGSNQFFARQSGATYFGGKTGSEGWTRSTMGMLAQNTTPVMQAHLNDITNRMVNGTTEEKKQAAIQLSEAQALLPNTSAGNQEVITAAMTKMGIHPNTETEYTETVKTGTKNVYDASGRNVTGTEDTYGKITRKRKLTMDEQIANVVNTGNANGLNRAGEQIKQTDEIINSAMIGTRTRKYGDGVPYAARGEDPTAGQQQQPPPGAPTNP